MRALFHLFVLLSLSSFFASCGVQSIPKGFNQVEADWAEVQNQYKRRADLVPNLVNTVKGYASHEKETLQSVIEARAKATSMNISAKELSPDKIKQFQQGQSQLTQALGRLMVVSERYPNLKASENFQALQAQLEGTENRIAIARRRFIESVKNFNNLVSVFPTNITNSVFYNYEKKPQFSATPEEQQNPKVEF